MRAKDLKCKGKTSDVKRTGKRLIIAPIIVFSPEALKGGTDALCLDAIKKDGKALMMSSSLPTSNWKRSPEIASFLPRSINS